MFTILPASLGLLLFVLALRAAAWLWYLPSRPAVFGEQSWVPSGPRRPLDDGEPVEFLSADGVRLRGVYLPTPALQRHGVIVFCHELNADRCTSAAWTDDLRRQGFEILAFDFRNHGQSDRAPGYQPTPWATEHEAADVRAAIDYAGARRDADPRGVGLLGVRRGAAAAIAAACDRRVRAVVAENFAPTEATHLAAIRAWLATSPRPLRFLARLPEAALSAWGAVVRAVVGRRRHCRFVRLNRIAPRVAAPVLVVQNELDQIAPPDLVRRFCRRFFPAARLWIVPSSAQAGVAAAGQRHQRRLARFFLDHLAAESPWDTCRAALREPVARSGQPTAVRPGLAPSREATVG